MSFGVCRRRGWDIWMCVGALGYRGRRGGPGPFPLEPSAWACAPALVHLECLGCGATSGLWHPRAAGEAAEVLYHRALPAAGTDRGRFVTTLVSMAPCRVSGVLPSVSSAALPGVWGWRGRSRLRVDDGPRRVPCSPGPPPFCWLIDVVTLRSPGPGQSRARRGTDVHGERDRSSRPARGPLASPPRLLAACGRQGCGTRPRPRPGVC